MRGSTAAGDWVARTVDSPEGAEHDATGWLSGSDRTSPVTQPEAASPDELVGAQRAQDTELVAVKVGEHDPRQVRPLPDRHPPRAKGLESSYLLVLVLRTKVEVQA